MARTKNTNIKSEIIKSVEELINVNGVNAISLSDIAKKCNISKGTLYYYYSSKDDIVFDIIVKHIEDFKADFYNWLDRHRLDLTPKRFISVVLYKGVKLFNRAKMHVFIINQCMKGNEVISNKFNELWIDMKNTLAEGVGLVFKDMKDKDLYSYLLMIIMDGLVVQEVMKTTTCDEEKFVNLVEKLGESLC